MNGLLILNKPSGITSHDVVARMRRATGESSIGHLGTLDPTATGVLPLLLGKYTRLAQFFGQLEKSYTGSIRFGFATDTYDAEGMATGPDQQPVLLLEEIRRQAERFAGDIEQMPPPYSAKKIGGKAAYKLARAGQIPTLKPARIHIAGFRIDALEDTTAHFALKISSGGYVRSIAHEMGRGMGCGAHLSALCRTAAGPFVLEEALALSDAEALGREGRLESALRHPRTLLPELPAVTADAAVLSRLRNGAQVNLPEFSQASHVKIFAGQRELVAVGYRIAGTLFQPVAVFL